MKPQEGKHETLIVDLPPLQVRRHVPKPLIHRLPFSHERAWWQDCGNTPLKGEVFFTVMLRRRWLATQYEYAKMATGLATQWCQVHLLCLVRVYYPDFCKGRPYL